jgi:hypothetical protein
MRMRGAVLVLGLSLAVTGCSRGSAPPVGRWQGAFDSSGTMVLTRLEIDPKGGIYLSAPDATDIGPGADRAAIKSRLGDELETEWGAVSPRTLDFDGRIFRKPGGVAPQLVWDPDTKTMTAYIYLGMNPAIHVALRPVAKFEGDPWSQ